MKIVEVAWCMIYLFIYLFLFQSRILIPTGIAYGVLSPALFTNFLCVTLSLRQKLIRLI